MLPAALTVLALIHPGRGIAVPLTRSWALRIIGKRIGSRCSSCGTRSAPHPRLFHLVQRGITGPVSLGASARVATWSTKRTLVHRRSLRRGPHASAEHSSAHVLQRTLGRHNWVSMGRGFPPLFVGVSTESQVRYATTPLSIPNVPTF